MLLKLDRIQCWYLRGGNPQIRMRSKKWVYSAATQKFMQTNPELSYVREMSNPKTILKSIGAVANYVYYTSVLNHHLLDEVVLQDTHEDCRKKTGQKQNSHTGIDDGKPVDFQMLW